MLKVLLQIEAGSLLLERPRGEPIECYGNLVEGWDEGCSGLLFERRG